MKNIGIFCLIFAVFLCGFTKDNYRMETIENNNIKFNFYIPKEFCRYEDQRLKSFTDKIMDDKNINSYNEYVYKKCSDVDKINLNESEILTILIPKRDMIAYFNNPDTAKYFQEIFPKTDKADAKRIREKVNKIDIDEKLKNEEELTDFEKNYIRSNYVETLKYYSADATHDYSIINDNLIINTEFKLDNNYHTINRFSGFIKGLFVDIIYEDKNNKNELADRVKFAKYIKEIQEVNEPQLNTYFSKMNETINIKLPNFGNFHDISEIKSMNTLFHEKMFIQYSNKKDDLSKVFIGVNIGGKNFTKDSFYDMLKKLYKKNDVQIVKKGKQEYAKIYLTIDNKNNAIYYYPFRIKNFDLFITSSMFYGNRDIDKNDEKRIRNTVEKYIRYLKEINKSN